MAKPSRSSYALRGKLALPLLVALSAALLFATHGGCLVEERCFSEADCAKGEICKADGRCGVECTTDTECGAGLRCVDHRCVGQTVGPLECPGEMVSVADAFCVDRYEASRVDATANSAGADDSRAVSRKGVIPWQVRDNAAAQAACEAAGKSLCTPQQWRLACQGSAATVYGYGDNYEPATCNGIDLYGISGFRLLPTGALPECKSDWGVYDINGNLWEHTAGGNDTTIRGGAYNCIDSKTLHRCDYVPGDWTPSARGFRCCLLASALDGGAGAPSDAQIDVEEADTSKESGCLDEDAQPDVSVDSVAESGVPDVSEDPASEAGEDAEDEEAADTAGQTKCPPEMIAVGSFCMDRYEASHQDATAVSPGVSPVAQSAPGVLPWFPVTLSTARAACQAAGKRLCRLDEWVHGCSGTAGMTYGYGNTYDPSICNGIDTFCYCDSAACSSLSQCPYAHCFSMPSTEGPGPCGAYFHVTPTGSFPSCISEYGAYDVNGNVWELADTDDGLEHFRGGAYNCSDSEELHRCDHDGTWNPSAKGFRCCQDGEP